MPELPEITILGRQMQDALVDRTIDQITVLQPKCLNLPEAEFRRALIRTRIKSVRHHGKWILIETTGGWLVINLGMNAKIRAGSNHSYICPTCQQTPGGNA